MNVRAHLGASNLASDTDDVTTNKVAETDVGVWPAQLTLDFFSGSKRSHVHRSHRGPLMIQRPFYPEGRVCHVTLLHPPGGVVSGDKLRTQVSVNDGASAVVVTPGATKHYRSRRSSNEQIAKPRALGEVRQCLRVNNGTLEWLPNEAIHFDGSETKVDTQIHLGTHAHVIAMDVQVFGRRAGNLPFTSGRAEVGLSVYREGSQLLIDKLCVTAESLHRGSAGLRGYCVYGTLLATDASDELADAVTRYLTEHYPNNSDEHRSLVSATRLDDLLLVRFLGQCSEQALMCLRAVRQQIRPTVIGLKNYTPRVWST